MLGGNKSVRVRKTWLDLNRNEQIVLMIWLRLLITLIVLAPCIFRVVSADPENEKIVYWTVITGALGYWMPAPYQNIGSARSPLRRKRIKKIQYPAHNQQLYDDEVDRFFNPDSED